MDALVGFSVGFWDYVTFASLAVIGAALIGVLVFLLGLPGRVAIARKHPDAEAIYMMGWLGFLAVVPWMQAFMWAFKPTNVIDIRNLPKEEKRETDAMIARLKGEATTPDAGRPPGKSPPS